MEEEINDDNILTAYMCGWNDENDIYSGIKEANIYTNKILMTAYNIGRNHYILGDDISKFDLLTREEILDIIKK